MSFISRSTTFALICVALLFATRCFAANAYLASFDSARELYESKLNSPISAEAWESCGTSSDVFTIEELILNPDPPKAGSALQVTVKGNLKENVTLGTNITIKVKYNFITIYTVTLDLCEEAGKIPEAPQCPIGAGPLSITQNADIPGNAPPGRYNIRVDGKTDQGSPLFCVSLAFRL